MRRTTKPLLIALLTAGLIGGLIASAPAAGAAKSLRKFCEKAVEVETLGASSASGDVADSAADLEKGLKQMAKLAPTKKVRKAVKTTAKYYGDIADAGDADKVDYGQKQIAALSTIQEYVQAKCIPLGITPTT